MSDEDYAGEPLLTGVLPFGARGLYLVVMYKMVNRLRDKKRPQIAGQNACCCSNSTDGNHSAAVSVSLKRLFPQPTEALLILPAQGVARSAQPQGHDWPTASTVHRSLQVPRHRVSLSQKPPSDATCVKAPGRRHKQSAMPS